MLNRNNLPDLIRMIVNFPELADRQIAKAVGASAESVRTYRQKLQKVDRAKLYGTDGELLDGYDLDGVLNSRQDRASARTEPDWEQVEAKVKQGQKREKIWREYRDKNPDGLARSQFCAKLAERDQVKDLEMIHDWQPGYAAQVDFAGDKVTYRDAESGLDVECYLFVAICAYSLLTFVCAVPHQNVINWLWCCTRFFEFLGGVTKVMITDNLKAAVIKPGVEPVLQQHFLGFARSYNLAVTPAGPYQARHKGAVEGTVRIIQDGLATQLAEHHLYSLEELNAAIAALLPRVNDRLLQNRDGETRRSIFDREERKTLQPLPVKPFVYMETRGPQKVPQNFHIPIDHHEYSVPYTLAGKQVQARVGLHVVEICHGGKVVARHVRSQRAGHHTTAVEHMPASHRAVKDATPEGFMIWSKTCGPSTERLVEKYFSGKIPHEGLAPARALRNLTKSHTAARIEQACERAWQLKMPSITGVRQALVLLQDEEGRAAVKDALAEVRGTHSPNALVRRRAMEAQRTRRTTAASLAKRSVGGDA